VRYQQEQDRARVGEVPRGRESEVREGHEFEVDLEIDSKGEISSGCGAAAAVTAGGDEPEAGVNRSWLGALGQLAYRLSEEST